MKELRKLQKRVAELESNEQRWVEFREDAQDEIQKLTKEKEHLTQCLNAANKLLRSQTEEVRKARSHVGYMFGMLADEFQVQTLLNKKDHFAINLKADTYSPGKDPIPLVEKRNG